MGEPLISIVVPVYKKESYIEKCIGSVLDQSFGDIEVICINDHSPDKCGEILERLAGEDSRVHVITNDVNQGAGFSRNIGLQNARGKYLLFLDADDFLEPEFLINACKICEEKRLDILIYDYFTYNDHSKEKIRRQMPLVFRTMLREDNTFNNEKDKFSFQLCTSSSWIKIYNRQFVVENHLTYQNISSANDIFFNQLAGMCAKRIGYVDCCWLNYRLGTTEQITNKVTEHSLNAIKAGVALKKAMVLRGLYGNYKCSFHTWIFAVTMKYIKFIPFDRWEQYYSQIRGALITIIDEGQDAFLSSHYQYWYRDFMNLTCYDEMLSKNLDNEYYYIFLYEKEKMEPILNYVRNENYKIALWGNGFYGQKFYKAYQESGFSLDCIVDQNIHSDVVLPLSVLKNKKYIVFVPSAPLVSEVVDQARQLSEYIKIIDMQSYLSYGIELQKCIY